jgi:branched-chain amino acid transport system permease protein
VTGLGIASGVSLLRYRNAEGRLSLPSISQTLAILLAVAAAGYVVWKITESGDQALQFTFNGLSVGAAYALLAMGFTLVYSTVWFFDMYYGAAAAMGAYGVFYLRAQTVGFGSFESNNLYVNIILAAVTAGVTAWAFHEAFGSRLRARASPILLRVVEGVVAVGAGAYVGFILAYPHELNVVLSPAIGVLTALVAGWLFRRAYQRIWPAGRMGPFLVLAALAAALGAYCGLLVSGAPGARLYLSWGVSCLLTGTVSLALYRGLYVHIRQRARSPLIMLVATLGILLAIIALLTILFQATARPLPEAFGSQPWAIGGATIKGFNVFAIGVAIVGFLGLLLLLKRTAFGKAVRAIGDDEEVSKVVGINTTAIIASVFFIGAVFAALAGLLSGHDTAIQSRMGLLLLLKGWIASVVGGMGNLYGAILGGFTLGIVEQFGIWDLAGEWKDAISFILLILFLSFWPKGMLPRK